MSLYIFFIYFIINFLSIKISYLTNIFLIEYDLIFILNFVFFNCLKLDNYYLTISP